MVAAAGSRTPVAPLLRPPVRWGWELCPPRPAQPSPERSNPPAPVEVATVSRARLPVLGAPWFVLAGVWLLVIVVDAAARGRGPALVVMGLVSCVVAVAAAWRTYGPRTSSGGTKPRRLILFGLGGLIVPYISLIVEAIILYRAPEGRELVPAGHSVARAEQESAEAVGQWQQRVVSFEEADRRRVAEADLWYPVTPSAGTHLVCCFGGSPDSWAVALVTLAGSLLGDHRRVLIGNLSRRDCTRPLAGLAQAASLGIREMEVGGASGSGLLAGLSWDEMADLLVEVAHARQRDADTARRERLLDRSVLQEVARCLDPGQPRSIRRLRMALEVVQGTRSSSGHVGPDEEDCLTDLYNDVQRQHADVLQRVVRLGRFLRDLEVLDPPSAAAPEPAARPLPLQLISVDRRSQSLDNELLADAIFQLLLRRVRTRNASAEVLVVLGADRISSQQLEMLSESAAEEGLQVFLFFEHLREDAVTLLGAGGAAAGFFALPNHREAAEAVSFIGTGYKWVESQRSRSVSESITKTTENQASFSNSFTQSYPMGGSQTSGDTMGWSLSEALGSSRDFSSSDQRVNEALIEPQVLMGLPLTCMIYVEVLPGGRRRIANVETNPTLNYADKVAAIPRD